METTLGYSDVAYDYRKAGWKGVLPIPHKEKGEPPTGYTGVSAGWPDADQVKSWARGKNKQGNVALRMPQNVIGIDIDHGYHGKTGADTIAELEKRWGTLPATYHSGSRPVGGIYYFKIPEEVDFPGGAGKDVDIIQFRHRYAMVWPSIHPEGNQYVWRDSDDEVIDFVPGPDQFPDLPRAWVQGLEKNSFSMSTEIKLSTNESNVWLERMRDGEACDQVIEALADGIEGATGATGSRHDSTLKQVWRLLGLGALGHAGVTEALQELREAYVDAVGGDRAGGEAEADADFQDMVYRGVRKRASTFPEPTDRCFCDSVAGTSRGQVRFAMRLADAWKDRLIYVHSMGWLVWDGKRWAKDEMGIPTRAVLDTLEKAKEEAKTLPPIPAADMFKDIRSCEGAQQVKGILDIARALPELAHRVNDLDADPTLFNVDNGIWDLTEGKLMDHDPTKLMTKVAKGAIDTDQTGPTFQAFLKKVLPDKSVRDYVQRLLGYAMLGRVQEHVLPIFTGTGGNGKGTLLEAVMFAFGDYAMSAEPALLIDHGQAHPTGQADLFGKRLAVASESNEKERLAAATVKRLTGGDTIKARFMRQDYFQFQPSHTIIMMTNHKPEVQGDDEAMWRRLTVVPFDVVIKREEMDGELPGKLECEATAILTWAAQGYVEYQKQKLNPPETVELRTAEYRNETDTLEQFLINETYISETEASSAGDVYQAYVQYCRANGQEYLTQPNFKSSMAVHKYAQKVGRASGALTRHYHQEHDPKARLVVGEPPATTVKPTVAEAIQRVTQELAGVNEELEPLDGPVSPAVDSTYERIQDEWGN